MPLKTTKAPKKAAPKAAKAKAAPKTAKASKAAKPAPKAAKPVKAAKAAPKASKTVKSAKDAKSTRAVKASKTSKATQATLDARESNRLRQQRFLEKHRDEVNTKRRERYADRKDSMQCPRCAKKLRSSKSTLCKDCLEKAREYNRA